MRALTRKLIRDLLHMKGQALAIAAVVATGVGMFVAYFSTFDSLRETQRTYYAQYRFADLFAGVKRAPLSLRDRLQSIDGVADVQLRTVVDVNLDIPDVSEPTTGRLIGIDLPHVSSLNGLFLRRGRFPEPGRPDEVLVTEGFAEARRLRLGDQVGAIVNGRRRDLHVVGVALSPEYVYAIRAGDMLPDPGRFGVFWMDRRSLAAAFDMEGGFNDLSVGLAPGASEGEVTSAIDRLLRPYGGLGVVPRRLQVSNWYLESELVQLETGGVLVPLIFLSVAAFLVNIVLHRLISVQREQVAALKALGYSNFDVGRHYFAWSLLVAAAGGVMGLVIGAWLGYGMTAMYNDFFRFPALIYRLHPVYVVEAVAIAFVAASAGAFSAVRAAVHLPPAEAMRPEPPASYRVTFVERVGLGRHLSPAFRMVLRNVTRRPLRFAMSVTGVAFSVAILVVGLFFLDALDEMLRVQFRIAQRQDVTVTFAEPASAKALHELRRLPGVLQVEPLRALPVRLRAGYRSRQTSILGLVPDPRLSRVVDISRRPIELAPDGLVLSAALAGVLDVGRGDTLVVEVLEGTRPTRSAVVSDVVREYMGTNVYMNIEGVHRLMREAGSLSGGFILADRAQADHLYRQLKRTPGVAGVSLKQAAIESFRKTIAENMGIMIFFNALFAGIIAFGVVYNAARIALSERSRDLASLRVLGFTRAEVSAILLGELAVIVGVAMPVGLVLGQLLAGLIVWAMESELYRIPLVVFPRTQLAAVGTVAAAALVSGLVVRHRVDHLDLIAVLKTQE